MKRIYRPDTSTARYAAWLLGELAAGRITRDQYDQEARFLPARYR